MTFPFSRKWTLFALFVLATGLFSLAVVIWAPQYKGLVWLYIYSIPSHVYISFLPHEPVLLYVGKLYHIAWVVLAAAAGTFVAGFIDYETLIRALKHKKIQNLYKEKKYYKKAVTWFYKAPFLVIFIAALTPIPYYPFKLLSIASNYPEGKYLLALTTGRIPRYFLLAYAGIALEIPNWILIVLFIAFLAMGFAKRGVLTVKKHLSRFHRHKKETAPDTACHDSTRETLRKNS